MTSARAVYSTVVLIVVRWVSWETCWLYEKKDRVMLSKFGIPPERMGSQWGVSPGSARMESRRRFGM